MGAQKHVEAPKSTYKENRPPRSSINDSRSSNVDKAVDRQDWRNAKMIDGVSGLEGEPIPSGSTGNTFLAKRECL